MTLTAIIGCLRLISNSMLELETLRLKPRLDVYVCMYVCDYIDVLLKSISVNDS